MKDNKKLIWKTSKEHEDSNMNKALVGYTGFVGSNIYIKAGNIIGGVYNSKNIKLAYRTNPDTLIYAGLRAEKFLANTYPDKDRLLIEEAKQNIKEINPKKLILISTIDVFKKPINVTEESNIDVQGLQPYGYNRYRLELWVRENYPNALIIRLPALFGINLKKNFLYDFINIIPQLLKKEKMDELLIHNNQLTNYYELQDTQFYKLKPLSEKKKSELKKIFQDIGFSALNFTDSRSIYQFYNLARLWEDIQIALKNDIKLWHPATEPVSATEIYKYLTGEDFVNEIMTMPAYYDYKTVYSEIFGGKNGYINSKIEVLNQIKNFIIQQTAVNNG